jgi:HD-GYP domain-containing protein (c-di-GMP phosphodiesterase class II)
MSGFARRLDAIRGELSRSRIVRACAVVQTLALAYLAIQVGGGVDKFNPQLMYVAIIPAAFWFGPLGGLITGVAAGLLAGPASPAEAEPYVRQAAWDWAPRMAYFSGVGLTIGIVNARLQKQSRVLRQTTEWLAATTRDALAAREDAERHAAEARRQAARLEDVAREIELVHAIDRAILDGASEREIFRLSTESVGRMTGASFCAIILVDERGAIELVEACPRDGEGLRRIAAVYAQLRPGESAAGWAIVQGEPAYSEDILTDPRYERLRSMATDPGFRATLAVPLITSDRVVGAIATAYAEPRRFRKSEIERLKRFAGQLSVAIEHVRQQEALRNMTFETVLALAESIESRDPYTGGHCKRLVAYAELLAREAGLAGADLETVRFGAALHDSGKVGVPDAVLKKAGPLTPEEWAEMRLHPYIGGQLCKRVSFLRHIYPVVYHHHERYDGTGYPDGLKGDDIPLAARIVTIADAYDAMTSERPYRGASDHEYAVSELRRCAGTQFDPKLVELFIAVLERERASGSAPFLEERAA